jgi:heme-degrading monooxygenase HmoA
LSLFIAMNHFDVDPQRAEEFEARWRERESQLQEVPGFLRFALLRGETPGQYVSHSSWVSRDAFEAWTRSEAFRRAHAGARMPEGVVRGHPRLSTFEALLEQEPSTSDSS